MSTINDEPIYYIPSNPGDGGPVCLWHESLLERRAWELLVTRLGVPGTLVSIKECFDTAQMFAEEAAKRRGGS